MVANVYFHELTSEYAEIRNQSKKLKTAKDCSISLWGKKKKIQKELRENYDDLSWEERGEMKEEIADLAENIDTADASTKDEERELKALTKNMFHMYGRRLTMSFFVDTTETNNNAPIHFYDEFGNTIQSNMEDKEDEFGSLVISTCRGSQPLTDYEHNSRFTKRYSADCYVVFATIDGDNVIVVRYTSGNIFLIRNHIGVRNMNYFEYIETAAAYLQN